MARNSPRNGLGLARESTGRFPGIQKQSVTKGFIRAHGLIRTPQGKMGRTTRIGHCGTGWGRVGHTRRIARIGHWGAFWDGPGRSDCSHFWTAVFVPAVFVQFSCFCSKNFSPGRLRPVLVLSPEPPATPGAAGVATCHPPATARPVTVRATVVAVRWLLPLGVAAWCPVFHTQGKRQENSGQAPGWASPLTR